MTAAVIGHRRVTEEVASRIKCATEQLVQRGVDVFLFGSRSAFGDMVLDEVTRLKSVCGNLRRVYVRAEYPEISAQYKSYLLRHYDDTFMPSGVFGRAAYVQRNFYMIDNADVCLFYCDCSVKDCAVGKSGARIAYEYAVKRRKEIVNLWHSRQR